MLVGILNSDWNLHTFKLMNQSDPAEGKFAFKWNTGNDPTRTVLNFLQFIFQLLSTNIP